jgi:DNA-binding NtrC family response regulator
MCAAELSMDPADHAARKRVILVVEDEPDLRMLVADYLRDVGFNVLEADNARDAMMLMESDFSVDLVFSDINLFGDMDGYALANWLRMFHPMLPVILCSGNRMRVPFPNTATDRRFIAKPYDVVEVERQMRELLG